MPTSKFTLASETAHILPVLFGFCTPAKYCFRALASFNRHAWNVPHPARSKQNSLDVKPSPRKLHKRSASSNSSVGRSFLGGVGRRSSVGPGPSNLPANGEVSEDGVSTKRSLSRRSGKSSRSSTSGDDKLRTITSNVALGERFAGDPSVYEQLPSPYVDNMIRERVSIRGQIRPLEPEDELPACTMPPEKLGVAGELALRRYLEGQAKWDERYGRTAKRVQKKRARNLALAKKETVRNVAQLQMHFFQDANGSGKDSKGIKAGLRSAASWAWAWALDGLEKPPPSSIVARRDTEEARRLSRIADEPVDSETHPLSANNLWSFVFSRLGQDKDEGRQDNEKRNGAGESDGTEKDRSTMDSARARRTRSLLVPRKRDVVPRRYVSASAVVRPRREESVQETEEEDDVDLHRTVSSS